MVAGFVGIAATCKWCLKTDEARVSVRRGRKKRNFAHSPTGFRPTGAISITGTQPET